METKRYMHTLGDIFLLGELGVNFLCVCACDCLALLREDGEAEWETCYVCTYRMWNGMGRENAGNRH